MNNKTHLDESILKPPPPHWAHILVSFFPSAMLLVFIGLVYHFIKTPNFLNLFLIIGQIYLLPVFIYRLFTSFFPIKEGIFYLDKSGFQPWFVAIKLQLIYIAYPCLEQFLLYTPGLYSFWLRLWGSKIGKGVFWTPLNEVADRGLLEVGNQCFFGHRAYLSSHVITVREGRPILYIKKIKLGNRVLIGMSAKIGPGVQIDSDVIIPVTKVILPNAKISNECESLDERKK